MARDGSCLRGPRWDGRSACRKQNSSRGWLPAKRLGKSFANSFAKRGEDDFDAKEPVRLPECLAASLAIIELVAAQELATNIVRQ